MTPKDRTGEVWVDRSFTLVGEVLLVVGPGVWDEEGDERDVKHPVLMLDSEDHLPAELMKWYEFKSIGPWETDESMERLF